MWEIRGMVAARETDDEADPDILFSGKYPPETVVVEQQVMRDGRLVVVVRRKRPPRKIESPG